MSTRVICIYLNTEYSHIKNFDIDSIYDREFMKRMKTSETFKNSFINLQCINVEKYPEYYKKQLEELNLTFLLLK